MKKSFCIFYLAFLLFVSTGFVVGEDKKPSEYVVVLYTTMGDIKLKLYNETPKHRDNFIKLVENHTYDSCLFHRVIQGFMVQGGDPDSKKAAAGTLLGNGNVGYTIPAEIVPQYYHKRGALAAARLGDDVNPNKESSGCQFYIVQGRVMSENDLNAYEARLNVPVKQKLFNEYINREENKLLKEKFIAFQKMNKVDSLQALGNFIEPIIQKELEKTPHFTFSSEQKKTYTTVGGAPHLDGAYTVFGEILEGMDVVDKIGAASVDQNSRPVSDIKIIKATIVK